MPTTSDTPQALAYAPDGTLGIGLADYQTHHSDTAAVIRPGSSGAPVAIPVTDSRSIISDGASGFIVGSANPSLLSAAGTVTPIAAPVAAIRTIVPESGPAIMIMPNGQFSAMTSAGVFKYPGNAASVTAATAGSVMLQLPGAQCPPPISTNGTPPPTPTGLCYPEPRAMTIDGAGGIWVVPGTNGESVEQIVS